MSDGSTRSLCLCSASSSSSPFLGPECVPSIPLWASLQAVLPGWNVPASINYSCCSSLKSRLKHSASIPPSMGLLSLFYLNSSLPSLNFQPNLPDDTLCAFSPKCPHSISNTFFSHLTAVAAAGRYWLLTGRQHGARRRAHTNHGPLTATYDQLFTRRKCFMAHPGLRPLLNGRSHISALSQHLAHWPDLSSTLKNLAGMNF